MSQPDILISAIDRHLPNNRYDECLSIESSVFEHGTYITGQYCNLDLGSVFRQEHDQASFSNLYQFILNNSLIDNSTDQEYMRKILEFLKSNQAQAVFNSVGFCLPKNCEPREITQIINICMKFSI